MLIFWSYIFTLRRCSFVVLFVLLFDNNYLFCHKNKQLEQVLEINMLYLMITLINKENVITKRSRYKSFAVPLQFFVRDMRLLKLILVIGVDRLSVAILSNIITRSYCSYDIILYQTTLRHASVNSTSHD